MYQAHQCRSLPRRTLGRLPIGILLHTVRQYLRILMWARFSHDILYIDTGLPTALLNTLGSKLLSTAWKRYNNVNLHISRCNRNNRKHHHNCSWRAVGRFVATCPNNYPMADTKVLPQYLPSTTTYGTGIQSPTIYSFFRDTWWTSFYSSVWLDGAVSETKYRTS